MKFRSLILAVATLAITVPAFGQTKSTAGGPPAITVADAISIWNAINVLDNHQTGVIDGRGNPVTAPNNFEYSGAVHLALARDGAKAFMIVKEYNEQLAKLRAKFNEDKKSVTKEQLTEFTAENLKEIDKKSSEMLAAPASDVAWIRIKATDLCLDAKPPECPVKNAFPIGVLEALLPILDEK